MPLKKIRFTTVDYTLFALVATAILLRFLLIRFNWPITDSDESTMDLMALHIAYRHELPLFFYGQQYMGPLEAYLAAPLFKLHGDSVFALRLTLLPFFAAFLICMFYITRWLYNEGLALVTVGLLGLGTSAMIRHQLLGIGGYPEIVCFGGLIFLIALLLARTAHVPPDESQSVSPDGPARRWRRALLYALWGCIVGFSLWVDELILPVAFAAGCFLLLFCWRDIRSWLSGSLVAGFVVGASPLIYYNLTAPLDHSTLNVLINLQRAGASDIAAYHISFLQRLEGVFLVSIPMATGAVQFCTLPDTFYSSGYFGTLHPRLCATFNGLWTTGVLLLWGVALTLALVALWQCIQARQRSQRQNIETKVSSLWLAERRQEAIRQAGRAMLLISAAISCFLFVTSTSAALYPMSSSRYLICVLFATPATLWPLWRSWRRRPLVEGQADVHVRRSGALQLAPIVRVGILLLIATAFLLGTIFTFGEIPAAQQAYNEQLALVHYLEDIGATRIYSEYWTCNRTIFLSHERIICAVLNKQLGQGYDRYKPYRYILRATPHPAYVFPLNTPHAATLVLLHGSDPHYRHRQFKGYIIYQYRP